MLRVRPSHAVALGLSVVLHGVWSIAIQRTGSVTGMPVLPPTPSTVVHARLVPDVTVTAAVREGGAATAVEADRPPTRQTVFAREERTAPLPVVTTPEPYYFSGKELSERPKVLHSTNPDPVDMMDVPPQTAVFRLLINEHGTVDRVIPENSSLPERAQQAMIAAFMVSKFEPGKIDAVNVKSQMRVEILVERDTVSF